MKFKIRQKVNKRSTNTNTKMFMFSRPFVSSPEHEVLMVSYWDSAVSGVRRPSSVVRRPSSTFYLVYALEATVLVGYS